MDYAGILQKLNGGLGKNAGDFLGKLWIKRGCLSEDFLRKRGFTGS